MPSTDVHTNGSVRVSSDRFGAVLHNRKTGEAFSISNATLAIDKPLRDKVTDILNGTVFQAQERFYAAKQAFYDGPMRSSVRLAG